MNHYGRLAQPFFFAISFDKKSSLVCPPEEIEGQQLVYDFNGFSNSHSRPVYRHLVLEKRPVSYHQYLEAFGKVHRHINVGNSYLVNLTFETPLVTNYSLTELFQISRAKYKLLIPDQFLVFAPETFIRINQGRISSYPMKGTINAAIENAASKILHDRKEMAEHATIVDLIRNDLSMVAKNVEVNRFRYLDHIKTHDKDLIQVSSEISGQLPDDYQTNIGDILFTLLPAGSISGAPKARTLEIIQEAETHNRGFYTGICGYYDGKNLDSGVMIRFIEKRGHQLYYKSGGGITSHSDPSLEYQEYIDKIYVPFS